MATHNYRIIPRQPKARSDKGSFPLLPSQTRLYYSFKICFVEKSIDDVEAEENETPQGRRKNMKRAEVLFSVEGRFSQFVKFRQQVAEKFPHLPLPELTDTNPHNIGLPSDQEQADRKRRIAIMLHVVANGLPTTPASREIPNASAAAAGQRRRDNNNNNNNNPPITKSPDTVPVDFLEKMLAQRNEENSNHTTGAENNDRDHPHQETIDLKHKFDLSNISKTSNVWESEEKFTRSLIVQLKNLEQHFSDMLKGIEVEASAYLASFSVHAQEIVRICQGKEQHEEEDGDDFNVTEIPEDDDDQDGNGESSNGNTINRHSSQRQQQQEQQQQAEEIDRETSVSSANSSSSLPPLESTPFPTSAGAAAATTTPTARQQQDVVDDIDHGENHQRDQKQEQEQEQNKRTAKKNDKPLDEDNQVLIFRLLQQRASGIKRVLDQINLLLQFLNGVHNLASARSKEWCQLYRLIRDADEYYSSSVRRGNNTNNNNNDDPRSEYNTNEVPINALWSYLEKLAGKASTTSFTASSSSSSSSSSASAAAGDTISNFLSNAFSSERRNASSYFSELHRREQQKQQEKDRTKDTENNNNNNNNNNSNSTAAPGSSPNSNNNNQNANQHHHQRENNNNTHHNHTHCSPSTLSPDSVEFRLISIIKRSSNALEKLYQDSYTPMRRFVVDDLYASLMVMIREALTKKLQKE